MPGLARTFCIDLRFWYPTPAYRYRKTSSDGLRNRANEAISTGSLQRMAYAMWAFGRTESPTSSRTSRTRASAWLSPASIRR